MESGSRTGRPSLVEGGLGEQAGEFDLAGAGAPVGRLAGAAGDGGGHHGHAGAVDGDVELVRHHRRRQHAHPPVRDRGGLGPASVPRRRRRRLRLPRSIRLGDNRIPASSANRSAALANGAAARGAGGHLAQPRRQRRPGDAELVVARHDPAPARGAVIVGAAHRDRAQHGVDVLVAVADELGVMARAAVDPRAAVAGVGGQQLLQQRAAQLRHRGADRQLHRLQARAERAQRGDGQRGQPLYLGRELRCDLRRGAPFSASVRGRGRHRGVGIGRACLADGLVDLHDLLGQSGETLVVGQLGAYLVHLAGRQLPSPGAAAGHRARPQIPRPVPGMIRLRARAIRLSAAAVVLADRAAPEVAGRGQLGIQPVPLLLQIPQRRIGHDRLLSGCLISQPD